MKVVLGTLAAAMLFGAVWAQPAEARCFWNGYGTVCTHHYWGGGPWHRWHRHYWHRGW